MNKKIVFIQGFSLEQQGGGAVILKKLINYSTANNYVAKVAVDANDVLETIEQASLKSGEYHIATGSRKYRWGIGRVKGFLSAIGFDNKGRTSLHKYLEQEQPDVIHLTAHGIGFPLLFAASKAWKKSKVVISVHDLWTFSVRTYLPSWLAKYLFRKILAQADVCYVISLEMGEYLKEFFGLKQYLIIHDGYLPEPKKIDSISLKKKQLNFLYVGLLHDIQLTTMQNLMDAMATFTDAHFTIGICSNTVLKASSNYNNIEIVNYGWVNSLQLAEISDNYSFGLLPLSFASKDELFYRTSLMTKIPFYLKQQLPIFCVGPANSASIQQIDREKLGVCVIEETIQELQKAILHVLNMNDKEYENLISNCQKAIQHTFNASIIAERFYKSL